MFTGLVAAIGHIVSIDSLANFAQTDMRVTVDAGTLPMSDVRPGDSIAMNGACMTVVEKIGSTFSVEISHESISRTTGLNKLGPVNLEKALTLADRLGGHLVSGHIDGVGIVRNIELIGTSMKVSIQTPRSIAKYITYKGSIVVNGVSLTINEVVDFQEHCIFSANIIPHTQHATTLGQLELGMNVNLEIDLIARYVERMLSIAQGGLQSCL